MSNNTRWSSEDFKKQGLIEVNGSFVKASSQVAKGKVDKLPNLIERDMPFVEPKVINLKYGYNINIQMPEIPELSAIQIYDSFKKTGIMYREKWPLETFLLPDGSYIDVSYSFDISPVSAPRMTQSDKWKLDPNHIDPLKRQRKPVEKYFKFKQDLLSLCAINGYNLTERLNILFVVPFPKSYSKKEQEQLNNQPHDQKPDIDNFSKSFLDSLSNNDRFVWNLHAIKLWGYKGRIIIF